MAVLAVLVWQTDQSKALYRHPWPETGLIRMAEDLDRVLRPALRSDPPFRIDPRRAPTLSLFCGFYFDWDTLGCYGGLAHVKTADLTWNASPQDNNVRYLITDRGAPSPPLPPEAKLVYQNPWFLLYEVPTYAARYRVGQQARGPAAGPPTPVFIHRSRRNEVVLDIPAGEHDSLWVTAPFHRRWKATVNGRPAPLTENRKLQRIPLPAHQYCRVRVFYSDPLLFFFLSVSALVALGFVMAVWGHLVLPLGRGPGGAGSVRGTTAAPGIAHATSFR